MGGEDERVQMLDIETEYVPDPCVEVLELTLSRAREGPAPPEVGLVAGDRLEERRGADDAPPPRRERPEMIDGSAREGGHVRGQLRRAAHIDEQRPGHRARLGGRGRRIGRLIEASKGSGGSRIGSSTPVAAQATR